MPDKVEDDVVELILRDHREFERLFDLMKREPDQRAMLAPQLSALLIAHGRAEEAEVYPAAREEAREEHDVEHSQEEHALFEEIAERLQSTDPLSHEFDTTLDKLVEAVSHHLEEEEETVLPGLRERLSAERRAELAAAFVRSRAEHMGEMPGEATRDEIVQQAENAGIEGISGRSKAELLKELRSGDS